MKFWPLPNSNSVTSAVYQTATKIYKLFKIKYLPCLINAIMVLLSLH